MFRTVYNSFETYSLNLAIGFESFLSHLIHNRITLISLTSSIKVPTVGNKATSLSPKQVVVEPPNYLTRRAKKKKTLRNIRFWTTREQKPEIATTTEKNFNMPIFITSADAGSCCTKSVWCKQNKQLLKVLVVQKPVSNDYILAERSARSDVNRQGHICLALEIWNRSLWEESR